MIYRVLLFCTRGHPSNMARVHASDCPMVNRGGRMRVMVRMSGPDLQSEIDDLNERGYPVKTCKCLTGRDVLPDSDAPRHPARRKDPDG